MIDLGQIFPTLLKTIRIQPLLKIVRIKYKNLNRSNLDSKEIPVLLLYFFLHRSLVWLSLSMLVPSPVIQVWFQNAMPLAAEDFNPLLKEMNKVQGNSLLHKNFPEKNLPFLTMLRSNVYSNPFTGKMLNCITPQAGKKIK